LAEPAASHRAYWESADATIKAATPSSNASQDQFVRVVLEAGAQRRGPTAPAFGPRAVATLGRWFGLSDGQLLDLFPNLANYSQRNLGFMAA